jgi:hypothetical protein
LTLVTCDPTVPSNCQADKTLNLNLKVKPDGEAAMVTPLGTLERPNPPGGEFRFDARVSQAQRHDQPEMAPSLSY